jgi:hypothetical protein
VDFAKGLSHGIRSASLVYITPEGMTALQSYIEESAQLDTNIPELKLIRDLRLLEHTYDIENQDDFEYGFWLGLYNTRRKIVKDSS